LRLRLLRPDRLLVLRLHRLALGGQGRLVALGAREVSADVGKPAIDCGNGLEIAVRIGALLLCSEGVHLLRHGADLVVDVELERRDAAALGLLGKADGIVALGLQPCVFLGNAGSLCPLAGDLALQVAQPGLWCSSCGARSRHRCRPGFRLRLFLLVGLENLQLGKVDLLILLVCHLILLGLHTVQACTPSEG
jgi:hypothetical protein